MKSSAVLLTCVLAFIAALTVAEGYYAYHAIDTEGEVRQWLCIIVVILNWPLAVWALKKPRLATICTLVIGGGFIAWEANQHRRLELLWQSADKISRWAQWEREISGHFPATLNASLLDQPWLKEHLAYEATPESYRIEYFVNQPGISYWYTPEKGLDYYPD